MHATIDSRNPNKYMAVLIGCPNFVVKQYGLKNNHKLLLLEIQ